MAPLTGLRHAARGLARSPASSVAAVLCLGLGIGATTAIYSAVHAALLRPLPFAEPERLVAVFHTTPSFDSGPFSPALFTELRREARSLEALGGVTPRSMLMHDAGEPARVSVSRAWGGVFPMLGVRPLLGRTLLEQDEDPTRPAAVLLTEEIWRERLGADPAVIGRTIRLDGAVHEIVGVLPRGFRIPDRSYVHEGDVWVPLRFEAWPADERASNSLMLIGRLRDGVSVASADAELRGVMAGIVANTPALRGAQVRVIALHEEAMRHVRGPLLLLLCAVGFVLLIAIANVASLLLARGVTRRNEFAMRTVLGARGMGILRPALAESFALTGTGAVLGIVLSIAGVRTIRALVPPGLPQLQTIAIEPVVLLFAILLSLLVAVLCGIAPALQAARSDPQSALRSSGRTGAGRAHQRFLRALVSVEVALSLVLLLGAGLVVRGFQSLVGSDPGFDPAPLLTMTVNVSPERYAGGSAYTSFLQSALERIEAVPEVRTAGVITLIPYTNWGWNSYTRYEGQADIDATRLPLTENRVVTPSFFGALGMRLVRGRLLTDADDRPDVPLVVVANEALVRRDFPDTDPIGQRFHVSDTSFATIVGVVRDIRNFGPDRPPQPEFYYPWGRWNREATSFPLVVRVGREPARAAAAVVQAIHATDDGAAISGVRTMDEVIAQSVGRPRFYLILISVFAIVALVLATAGLFGVMSYAVAQRTREIGIRSALGSTPARTVAFIVRQGALLVAAGCAAGLLGGAGLTRFLRSALYGVSPLDPLTWVAMILLLAMAALLAVAIPAARAARIDPLQAMRTE